MTRAEAVDLLLTRRWWAYGSGGPAWFEVPYHAFNLLEGAAWVAFAVLVLRRSLAHRRSGLEAAYALAFFAFGLTDFREAYALDSWLIWLKAANLAALVRLRSVVIRKYYPCSKAY